MTTRLRQHRIAAVFLTVTLTLTACAPSLEDTRGQAFTTIEQMAHLSAAEQQEFLSRVEVAQDKTTIDRIVDEAQRTQDQSQNDLSAAEDILATWVTGQRWQMSGYQESVQRGFEQLPADFNPDCYFDFLPEGELAVADACGQHLTRADSWTFDVDIPSVHFFEAASGDGVAYYTITVDSPADGQLTGTQERSTTTFDVSPLED